MTVDLQEWVGRTKIEEDVASGERARRLAVLLGDEAAAEPAVLFPLGHWLQFPEDDVPMSELGDDGHALLGGFMPPVGLTRRMWAGSALEFHSPIRPGQALARTSTIESVTEKAGRRGPLCFVVVRHEISADGTLATIDRHTIVYREGTAPRGGTPDGGRSQAESAAAAPRSHTSAPEGWDWVRTVRPDEVMLFRYSALTFNSHRIHYDHPYVTGVEGYPGLIVHGPLTATFLLDAFLRNHPNTEVTGYAFTAKSPVFVNEQIHLVGRKAEEGRYELEAVGPGGVTVMTAGVTAGERR